MASEKNIATVSYIEQDFDINALDDPAWSKAQAVLIDRYWSGEFAPPSRQFKARILWSDTSVYVRFDARLDEPLVVSDVPNLTKKSIGLWDRDVCEIFIASDSSIPSKYYEFEVAPTGEWLDVAVEVQTDRRISDWEYRSNMSTAARIDKGLVILAMRIEWEAFGRKPKLGDIWLGNLFRCVGKDPDRGYLAWRPTYTSVPSFHVPECFGQFRFMG